MCTHENLSFEYNFHRFQTMAASFLRSKNKVLRKTEGVFIVYKPSTRLTFKRTLEKLPFLC